MTVLIGAVVRIILLRTAAFFILYFILKGRLYIIVEAIDKRTGKTIKIEDAYSGQRLSCPYCGVDVHPVLKSNTQFFRCFEGKEHTHYLCAQLDGKANRAYDPKITDIAELFTNLFNPVREKDEPTWEPEDDEDPDMLDPENETLDGDEPTQTPEGGTDDGDDDENEAASGPVILPCRTLSQLWKAGIDKLGRLNALVLL